MGEQPVNFDCRPRQWLKTAVQSDEESAYGSHQKNNKPIQANIREQFNKEIEVQTPLEGVK